MKYKQPQHHRSRGKAPLPAHPPSMARSGGRRPPAKCDALLCDNARLALCLAELLGRDASQMYLCRKIASEGLRQAIDMGSLPP